MTGRKAATAVRTKAVRTKRSRPRGSAGKKTKPTATESPAAGRWRNRIVGFERIKARELVANPMNWREHGAEQRAALTGMLDEVGWVGAVIARRRGDGRLELIDGHLRQELDPDAEIPVLVVDLDDAEAKKVLATHDPIGAMAATNALALDALVAECAFDSEELQRIVANWLVDADGEEQPAAESHKTADSADVVAVVRRGWDVIVVCENEIEQRRVFERLQREGLKCRVLTY